MKEEILEMYTYFGQTPNDINDKIVIKLHKALNTSHLPIFSKPHLISRKVGIKL